MAATTTKDARKQQTSLAKEFAIECARMLANTRCHHVVVLDVTGISPLTDFLVLASGTSPRQMKTAADDVEELAPPRRFPVLSRSGDNVGSWIVVDFVDVVVHVFSDDSRAFYDLDGLWGDAAKVEWAAE